jgi:trans-2,3-dihydro-3-hydroxyanthranilate isomerase
MITRDFVIADVFTRKQFGGNQLAVYIDGRGLTTETMQNLAREMNYSETTFLLPPEKGGDFRVRIFTPEHELPFAGHPLVGSGFVIVAEGLKPLETDSTTVKLETGVGEILVNVANESGVAGHTRMTQPLPEVVLKKFEETSALAAALGIEQRAIQATNLPVQAINNGLVVLIVPVDSLATVRGLEFDVAGLKSITRQIGAETVLVFTRQTVEPDNSVHCRVSAPAAGVLEDAATGSANGPLGLYLIQNRLVEVKPKTTIRSEQGYEMHRPSILQIEVDVDQAANAVTGVSVGGGVVIGGRGIMSIRD